MVEGAFGAGMSPMTAAAIDLRETSKAERVYGDLRRRIRELALQIGRAHV